jgi:hypothetical protein
MFFHSASFRRSVGFLNFPLGVHPSVQGRVSFGLVGELLAARSKGQESGIVGARTEGVYTTAGEGNFATSRKRPRRYVEWAIRSSVNNETPNEVSLLEPH